MSEWKETELGKIPVSWDIYKVNNIVEMNIVDTHRLCPTGLLENLEKVILNANSKNN